MVFRIFGINVIGLPGNITNKGRKVSHTKHKICNIGLMIPHYAIFKINIFSCLVLLSSFYSIFFFYIFKKLILKTFFLVSHILKSHGCSRIWFWKPELLHCCCSSGWNWRYYQWLFTSCYTVCYILIKHIYYFNFLEPVSLLDREIVFVE